MYVYCTQFLCNNCTIILGVVSRATAARNTLRVRMPAIIAARCMQKLLATIADETTALLNPISSVS